MKIDGNSGSQDTAATDATRRSGGVDEGTRRVGGNKPAAGGTDRVELSGDAALLSAALAAASSTPPVRTELVDRMRQELADGKVGKDAGALADAIIDDLLK